MTAKYPPLRPDGLFEVQVRIRGVRVARTDVEAWIDDWLRTKGKLFDEVEGHVSYVDEYVGSPVVEGAGDNVVTIRLLARPGGRHWKYWVVNLTRDVIAAHPGSERISEFGRQ